MRASPVYVASKLIYMETITGGCEAVRNLPRDAESFSPGLKLRSQSGDVMSCGFCILHWRRLIILNSGCEAGPGLLDGRQDRDDDEGRGEQDDHHEVHAEDEFPDPGVLSGRM